MTNLSDLVSAFDLAAWLGLALRWLHVIAGIAWIGASFYFVWLDNSLTAPDPPREGVKGELWAVHGGGFYQSHCLLYTSPAPRRSAFSSSARPKARRVCSPPRVRWRPPESSL